MFYRQVWLVWGISFILLLVCNSVEQSTLPRDSYKEPESIKTKGQEEQPEGTTRKEDNTEKKVSDLGGKDENEILQSAENYGPVFLDLRNNTDNSSARKRDDVNSDIQGKKIKEEKAGKNKKVKDGRKGKNKKGKDGKKGKGKDENEILQSPGNYGPVFLDLRNNTDNSSERKRDDSNSDIQMLSVDAGPIKARNGINTMSARKRGFMSFLKTFRLRRKGTTRKEDKTEKKVPILVVDAAQIPESNISVIRVDAAQLPESNVSVLGVDAAQLPASNVSALGVDAAQRPRPLMKHAAGRYLAAAVRSEIAFVEPSESRFREDISAM